MEFDPEIFMNEVSQALRYSSPHPLARKRPATDKTSEDGEAQDSGSVTESDENLAFPAAKRRRLDFSRAEGIARAFSITPDNVSRTDGSDANEDGIPSFFRPSLDITAALFTAEPRLPPSLDPEGPEEPANDNINAFLMYKERLDLVPNFYAYTVKSCLLPIRRVQSALLTLYFHHIHPIFPVVDEYHIAKLDRMFRGREELMDPSDFTVYYAIMVAGFAHLSEAQVCSTPYRSVLEGQEAQVEQLKARYWSQPASDPMILTQVSLLLSLWSPGWIGPQNNSYWLDQAFKHAIAGKLWETRPDKPNQICRRRVLWWCCLIRDRVLALGMRRPYRLHKAPVDHEIISERDFGLEAKYPSYTDRGSKQVALLVFIWFCKLSKIMESIAVMQRSNRFARDWNGESSAIVQQELEEVNKLDHNLQVWLEEFEAAVTEATKEEIDQIVWVPISTLRIMVHSLRAGLYQPYLNLPITHPSLSNSKIDPLQQMKDGARQVAMSVSDVMQKKKCDAIPTWLVAWVCLPVAIYHVNSRIRSNSSPDQILMPFLAQLVRRTSGALMLLTTVRAATQNQIEKIAKADEVSQTASREDALLGSETGNSVDGEAGEDVAEGYQGFQWVHSSSSRVFVTRSAEARLLAFVTRAIDEVLEKNGSTGNLENGWTLLQAKYAISIFSDDRAVCGGISKGRIVRMKLAHDIQPKSSVSS